MNITLDDTSPQWQYTSANGTNTWVIDHVTTDNQIGNYFDQTFHGTYTDGDAATLTFNGTAITVYGAFRDNHGLYSAQIDGGNLLYQLGYSKDPKFEQILYSQSGLSADTEHTVRLVNLPSQTSPPANATLQWWFDIDYAVITTATTGQVYTTRFDDTSTYVSYSGTWGIGPPLEPQNYYNTTAHITSVVGDTVSVKFNGSSIQMFGGMYTDHGNYTVSLDGNSMGNFNGTWFDLAPQTSLFTATNLTDGPHQIIMTNQGGGPKGTFFDFDYAVVNSTIDPNGQSGSSSGTGTNTTGSTVGAVPSAHKSNTGAIAGGVVGGVAALAIIAALVWFFLRRKRNNGTGYEDGYRAPAVDLNGEEVKPYTDPNGANNAYIAASGYTSPHTYSTTSAQPTFMSSQPPMLSIPPPPPSNATSYPHSINPPSSIGSPSPIAEGNEYNPFTSGSRSTPTSSHPSVQQGRFNPNPIPGISSVGTGSTGASSTGAGDASLSPQTPPPVPTVSKAAATSLPYTARRPTGSTDSSSDWNSITSPPRRLQREGREMDLGPIFHEEQEHHAPLPPDYEQATEPLPGQQPHEAQDRQ